MLYLQLVGPTDKKIDSTAIHDGAFVFNGAAVKALSGSLLQQKLLMGSWQCVISIWRMGILQFVVTVMKGRTWQRDQRTILHL